MKRITAKLFCLIIIIFLVSCNMQTSIEKKFDIKLLKNISKLAVLECSFNNVAKIKQPAGSGIMNFGEIDRKMFIEYEGRVKIGIDINKVIEQYDANTNTITIPKVEVNVTANPKSYKYFISKDSWFNKNKIENDRLKEAISDSNNAMQSNVENNTKLMNRAQILAESQIKAFINSFGDFNINYIRE